MINAFIFGLLWGLITIFFFDKDDDREVPPERPFKPDKYDWLIGRGPDGYREIDPDKESSGNTFDVFKD